jgi:3-hydroxyisobutyrate dehydrogenase-like beta-hydroxyacid dehydrogenase
MSLTVAVLGLGEAGSLIAADLARAGIRVRGYDPILGRSAAGIERCADPLEAVREAEVVLSINWSRVALEVAQTVAPHLRANTVYADLNTASPARKLEVAAVLETHTLFADVALLNPVPGNGLKTPALVSGSGANSFVNTFAALGMPVESIGSQVGSAAARKLARSIFYKGLAACVGEALEAAEHLGCTDWLHDNIAQTLEGMKANTVERLLEGSRTHAVRRHEEMLAAAQMVQELGLEPRMAHATAAWLESIKKI